MSPGTQSTESFRPDQETSGRLYYAKCGEGKRHVYRYDKDTKEKVCLNCGNVRGSRHGDYQVHVRGLAS